MKLRGINEKIVGSIQFQEILSSLNTNRKMSICGLVNSTKANILYGIFENIHKNVFLISPTDYESKNIYDNLKFYTDDCVYFQERENVFYNVEAFSPDLKYDRIQALRSICSGERKIVCTSVESLTSLYMGRDKIISSYIDLFLSMEYEFEKLVRDIYSLGYERVSKVQVKGQYSVRGGIIDIFPINSKFPYRIEFFGDEINAIKSFNVTTQMSIENIKDITILQSQEFILNRDDRVKLYERIKSDFQNHINTIKDQEVRDKLKSRFQITLDRLKEFEFYDEYNIIIPYLHDTFFEFFEFMDNSVVIVDEYKKTIESINVIYDRFLENFNMLLLRGEVLPSQVNLLISKDKLILKLNDIFNLTFDLFSSDNNYGKIEFQTKNIIKMEGKVDVILNEIKDKLNLGYYVIILSSSNLRGEKLKEMLEEYGIDAIFTEDINDIHAGKVIISTGYLNEGYDFSDLRLYVISDGDIFTEGKMKRSKSNFFSNKEGLTKVRSFNDLRPGDYVVHVNHGIGVYKGIRKIEVQGIDRDYLDIEYDRNDKLYVPIEQLDLIQKYIGIEGKSPKINKLGGSEWIKIKTKTKKSIDEIAENLVKLYAKRNVLKGYAYSKDSTWQSEFEEEFPYTETPDQLSAISEIKRDMESGKPMDRLLCGDVGYGKTEVALRAMFKAVVDKKQVAFLVPTTILADQHYNNIKKRFINFPFNVDVLSRFRSTKSQKETLDKLKRGEVDIIIGTHRILSKDVEFKDLGLLVIDEEQRFGVKHKERIKELKENIDVLSLSATPIPRTLHMSMVGVRDISIIDTPPEDRYPVQTFVVEYSDQLVRGAILKEISRGGQGFFLYNIVENIDKMNIYLQGLVPECRFSVIHGQMGEREIEDIIIKFLNKEIDFLLCTTIIETGIDIKNANTIIIYNADKLGLSQLYQLRGRVGRSNRVSYAYLTYRKDKVLSEVAEKRLKTLKDFTELGSGFKVSMKDLEIRGSGNLIGEAQHGQMSVVGYDLYCKMLEDAIKMLQGKITHEEINTIVDIKIDAYIKEDYIEDEMQKLEIYKKISCIENEEDMDYIKDELLDRFAYIPDGVYNLIKISYIRALGKKLGFSQIKEVGNKVLFEYESKRFFNDVSFNYIYNNYQDKVILNFGDKPSFSYDISGINKEQVINEFIELLQNLIKENKL